MRTFRRWSVLAGVLAALLAYSAISKGVPIELSLPLKEGSVRFAVIGDSGTGAEPQLQVARQMAAGRQKFPFTFAIMLGDNIYGGKSAADFKRKFEAPYGDLMTQGVKFYASLGNHDSSDEILYKPFNMGGKRYYSFVMGNAEFFALDSNYMDPTQLDWLRVQLRQSKAAWKICFFHHPLYSDGKFHGPDLDLRNRLEPVLIENGVSVVFSGHDHVYERIKPQKGIRYFVEGNSGELRPHDLKQSDQTEKGFDTDQAFMLVEIAGEELHFQALSRAGDTVDSGMFNPRKSTTPPPKNAPGGVPIPEVVLH
jgi:hypothetical protein